MAYGIDVISSPKYGSIRVGELCRFLADQSLIGTGYYPNSTFIPTIIYYDDILPNVADKQDITNLFEQFDNTTFNSMDDVVTALQNQFAPLVTEIEWIFGAPDVGGFGVGKRGSGYGIYAINGYKFENDVYIPLATYTNIPYPFGYTVGNQIPADYKSGEMSLPPEGTYKTGIFFTTAVTYNADTNNVVADLRELRYNTCAVIRNAIGSYVNTQDNIVGRYEYTDLSSHLSESWRFYFMNSLPLNSLDIAWATKKSLQWHFSAYYPYWGGFSLDEPNVEGTSIFGGESAVIDTEGNPYESDGTPTGGGGGSQSRYSEPTLPEGVPALNLLNSGFVKLYNPTIAEVQQFASFLFSGITEEMSSVIKRMMVNPIDYILALNMIHIPLITSEAENIGFCGISSGVSANVVTEQYYQIEYRLDINEFWNTALDYSGYTKCKIYVPYCGIYDISIDEIMNGTLWLRYVIDVVSGAVIAFVGTRRVQKDGTVLKATLYQYNGNCILAMPVSQTNWQNTFSSILNIATTAIAPSPASVAGMAQDVMSQKVSLQKSGSIGANYGYLGKQIPYVILERPELSIPTDRGHHEGYPANHKRKLSEVHGYTEIKSGTLIANKFRGTEEELEMLKSALEEGVYL